MARGKYLLIRYFPPLIKSIISKHDYLMQIIPTCKKYNPEKQEFSGEEIENISALVSVLRNVRERLIREGCNLDECRKEFDATKNIDTEK